MPPRKKIRLTPAVGSGKNKPSVFKSLCLPNTGFMVDFLEYFTRDDFEKYLQLTCKRMNQLILTHFASKPYRYLDNVTLMCNLNVNVRQCCMMMCLRKETTDNNFSTICWDPYKLKWRTLVKYEVEFSKMLPFLDMSVRVPKVNIWINHSTVMKQENIDKLKSLSHVWKNAEVMFTSGRYSKENFASRAELLSEAKFFRCRRFKCSYVDAMLPLWDYPEIYSLEVIKFDISSLAREESDLTPLIKLVENRALYPHSQTTIVFTGSRYVQLTHHGNWPPITNDVLEKICNKLMESVKAQSFRIVFAIFVISELPDDEMDEIRLENNRTQEVFHLRHVTYNKVAKYCEFNANTKYYILERSLA